MDDASSARPSPEEIGRALAECMTLADVDHMMDWAGGTALRYRWYPLEQGGLPPADAQLDGRPLWFRATFEAWQRRGHSREDQRGLDDSIVHLPAAQPDPDVAHAVPPAEERGPRPAEVVGRESGRRVVRGHALLPLVRTFDKHVVHVLGGQTQLVAQAPGQPLIAVVDRLQLRSSGRPSPG